MKILVVLAIALIFACGCIDEPAKSHSVQTSIREDGATLTIVNYDKSLTPSEILTALKMAGTPDFIKFNIIMATTPLTTETLTYWDIPRDTIPCPGPKTIYVVPSDSCGTFIDTSIRGYAAFNEGGVVSTGYVTQQGLGMRILHELEHERGLPADDMVKYNFQGSELQWHIWLAASHPEAFA